MTLAIPDQLYKKMQKHSELKWSEVARQAFVEKITDMDMLTDLKAIGKAETEFKKRKTLKESELAKKLGIKI